MCCCSRNATILKESFAVLIGGKVHKSHRNRAKHCSTQATVQIYWALFQETRQKSFDKPYKIVYFGYAGSTLALLTDMTD